MNDETFSAKPAPRPAAPAEPSYIKIEKPWGNYPADGVLKVSDGLIDRLKSDGVPYREATDDERRIGGHPDEGAI
jgi:hypothetical protein